MGAVQGGGMSVQVPKGYQQTEVGVIPEDWVIQGVSSLTSKVASGKSKSSSNYGEHPLYGSTGEIGRTDSPDYSGKAILIARVGANAGSLYVVDGDYSVTDNTIIIKNNELIYFSFFWRKIESQNLNKKIYGSGQPLITGTQIKELLISCPRTLQEQQAIAEALSDADALIESLEQLIAKKRQIKQGAMQELLTGQRRLPGFSGEWRKETIKNIVQTPVTDGPHMTPLFLNDGIPFLSVNNLVDGLIDFGDLRYISQADHEEFSRKCKPQKGDILLGKAASVGKVAIVETDVEFNIWSPIALIRLNNKNHGKYIYYQLQSDEVNKQISLLTNTSSQGNIGMGDIEKIVIPTPDKDEQIAIAEILTTLDAEIEELKIRVRKALKIKQSMMQELLTGRIRLI